MWRKINLRLFDGVLFLGIIFKRVEGFKNYYKKRGKGKCGKEN
jgi:hypothetical protein